jgi:hypothetical protein
MTNTITTTKEARKVLRNLLVDWKTGVIHLPRTALSEQAKDACNYLIDRRGFRFGSTVI